MTVLVPGVYANISEAAYNADPCGDEVSLRSSIAWKLVERGSTPRHAWFASPRLNPYHKADNRRMFDIGRACHAMLLGQGSEYAIIRAKDYRSKFAQEQRDAAYANNKIPLLESDANQVKAMAKAAREQLQALVDAGTLARIPFGKDETEVTLIWRDNGVLCRARLDYCPKDGEVLYEYKTTSASADPSLWGFRQFRQLGYDNQLAFYRRGLEVLKVANSPAFGCIVQETFEPYLLSFVRVDDEVIMRADEKVKQAMKIWAQCLKTGVWPGYSLQGYDIDLTEKERAQDAREQPGSEHLHSEDVPVEAYSKVTFKKKAPIPSK